jgi:hypothetical protein
MKGFKVQDERVRGSGLPVQGVVDMGEFMRVEDLKVYQKLCQLHIEVCELTRAWPSEEPFELGWQVRRSSNSSPANLAERDSDRHIRNKIEGVNRARGEALETVHHL